MGALQGRRDLLDVPTNGFECTVAVADVEATRTSATAAGGRLLMDRSTIPGVGHLIFLADPSGNVVGAMQYDTAAE
jgi:predicted enzyme related to lactoylglutathione lyase